MNAIELATEPTESRSTDEELAQRHSVAHLVAVFQQAERDIADGFAKIADAKRRLNSTFCGKETAFHLRSRYGNRLDENDFDDPEHVLNELRRSAWCIIVDNLEIKRFCSIAAAQKLEHDLTKEDPLPLTVDTVMQLAHQFRSQMRGLLEEAIEEVFNFLRPPGSKLKTNSEFEIGERVILENHVERAFYGWRVNHYYDQRLTALENVFRALDGKGQVTKGYYSDLTTAIQACKGDECEGETEYFAFRGFKRRTLHLRFKRLDLLARLNQIAGGKRLRT